MTNMRGQPLMWGIMNPKVIVGKVAWREAPAKYKHNVKLTFKGEL